MCVVVAQVELQTDGFLEGFEPLAGSRVTEKVNLFTAEARGSPLEILRIDVPLGVMTAKGVPLIRQPVPF